MRWWNDLWLNEGFATMMAPKAADHVENSTLRTSQYFTADVALKALSGDQHARTTQPISLKKNSDRVHVQDSKILYNKGATVLRMVESTIGADVFRRGLNPYLRKFAYSNADKNDFLASFSLIFNESDHREDAFVSSNFSVSDFIDSWIYQPGFPLLEVRRTRGHFEISQNIFDVDENPAFANLQWKVPIFVGRGEKRSVLWLKENETVILHDKKRPFLIDIDSHGYYRVVYDEETWNDITDLLLRSYEELPVSTRLKLLDDAFVLSEYGRIPYSIPLRMSQYLREEHEVMPFLTFFARYEYIHQRLFRHPNATLMDKYVQFLLEPMFATIVSENRIDAVETVMEKEFMRELVLLKMCVSGYRACIEAVRPKFDELRKSCAYGKLSSACNRVDPSMRSIVYMVASKYGNQSDFLFLREKHREEEYHAERDRLFSAMAFASNRSNIVALVKEVLAIKDRDTDFRPKLFELARKNYDNEIISDYLHYNFNELLKNHKKYASFFILQMSRMYGTGNDVLKLDDFERKYSNLLGRMKGVLRHVREDIKRKIDWTKRYSNEIFRFLASRV
ncbi:Aminopeptidase N [Toxocara canis]|uniref:Aminopeptidase N n=1 Tax=Toxocara canis TaxID=6265 RepID=A0A0B2W1A8_TOXCA|nr:Aminopeptidase N [Toxocara canis]